MAEAARYPPAEVSAFRALPKHVMLVDRAARVQAVNARVERLLQRLFVNRPVPDELALPDVFEISREEALREMIIAASGDGILLPLRAATSGLPRRIRFRVGAIRDGGRETSGFVLVSDNADPLGKPFRELNAELESANAKARRERQHRRLLQKSNDDLYAANAELKSFAYAVSHDLKSPVQTVSMLLSELDEFGSDKLDAEKSELVSMSRETLSRMSVLIEDLLRSTHLIGSEIKLAPCALERTVEEVIADLRAEITGAGARVQTGALPVVRGDAVMLRILFQNLLSNAIKFRHPDRRPEIVIGAGPPDAEGRIESRWRTTASGYRRNTAAMSSICSAGCTGMMRFPAAGWA